MTTINYAEYLFYKHLAIVRVQKELPDAIVDLNIHDGMCFLDITCKLDKTYRVRQVVCLDLLNVYSFNYELNRAIFSAVHHMSQHIREVYINMAQKYISDINMDEKVLYYGDRRLGIPFTKTGGDSSTNFYEKICTGRSA